jgi:hypothetical protein
LLQALSVIFKRFEAVLAQLQLALPVVWQWQPEQIQLTEYDKKL